MTESGPRLHAVTQPLDRLPDALEHADPADPLVWARGENILVGFGETLRFSFHGSNRIQDAADAWQRLAASADVTNPLTLPGTGIVAFGSFTFAAASSQSSVLRIPRFVFGRRDSQAFVTEIRLSNEASEPLPLGSAIVADAADRVRWNPARDASEHQQAVRDALAYIQAGSVQKVVLARAMTGTLPSNPSAPADGLGSLEPERGDLNAPIRHGFDLRAALQRLIASAPNTWVFAVDGLLGASPETLLSVTGGQAHLEVLAGTRDKADGDGQVLLDSSKDRSEHRFAVENVTDSLRRAGIAAPKLSEPHLLSLPDLWHLSTDIDFETASTRVLSLVAALHPTGAVAGTPTEAALKIIEAFEPIDRGRYSGPVGWVDAAGNGEWAIALRCAQVAGEQVIAYAGGGIVSGSDPALEYAETELKFRAIRSAL